MTEAEFIVARPPSINKSFGNRPKEQGGRGRYPLPALLRWRETAGREIQAQGMRRFLSPVTVALMASETGMDNRARDGDNLTKATLDLLVSLGVILADSRKIVRKSSVEWTEGEPGTIRIVIREAAEPPRSTNTPDKSARGKCWALQQLKRKFGIVIGPERIHLQ